MKIRTLAILFTMTLGLAQPAAARTGADNVASACATLEFMAKMLTLNVLLPHDRDNTNWLEQDINQLSEMNRLVCQRVLQTGYSRGNTYYGNGSLASTDLYHQPWYFPNGQLFMLGPGEDTPIYYPNGQVMSFHWMHGDQPLFWPNGSLATPHFREYDVTWYYPDGQIITYEAGKQRARWFYPFPRFDGLIGQEEISKDWGFEGEDFTYLQFRRDGSLFTTRERIRNKLVLTDYELLDVPGVLLMVTRLYQADDPARQFSPADANISGAPF